ncbi:glycerol-3-phosphate 1-O-acyltransferase [Rhodococcus sp. SORGH_AS_0301]|uniref:glycerol-3-phosphate 1-O-acyltransferase n=1 Tax=Rhodococcus sp. SORGH_AS_0301 TaxID=3041780 RepID=UPI00278522B5|nr:glycerol-3-phosphate 1-O-acyltransferase [Rhodococcus sp. SORGH_AS_0301]MDQ1182717.1 glycerol-3-phosphate O-acyltransferase [Rhodococcus sp. SORGH_AS_0301]
MSQLDSTEHPLTGRSSSSDDQVFLIDAVSDVDVHAADDWIDRHHGDGRPESVVMTGKALDELTERAGGADPLITPLRVSWTKAPRKGFGLRVGRARRGEPRIIEGEPASLSALRERFEATAGRSLSSYIARQASLTLDKAEREVIGSEYKVPRFVVEEMTERSQFRADLAELAASVDTPVSAVNARVHEILDEMVATENKGAVELWGQLGAFFSRAYRVEVDTEKLAELRDLDKSFPLVFLPNHRSYLDPLVLRPALLEQGFPLNHVMGGINVGFWPIGPLAKRSGVVLIQRKFSDAVYKWTLRQYMSFLLSKKFNLEWYIEGGRSRTGKLRPPRFGLLTYLFDALENSTAADAYLVPTSITYDRLHEVGEMAKESHGATKQTEGIRMAIGYVRAQGQLRGTVYLRFGTPMSARQFLDEYDDKRVAVQRAALAVSHAINESTPVTPAALVAMAMLGIEDRALNKREMWSIIEPLASYIQQRGLPTAGGVDLTDIDVMTAAVRAQVAAGVVRRFDDGPEPLFLLAQDKHLVASFFRNNAIHFFVMRAIGELVVLRTEDCPTGEVAADDLWKSALELRDMLKFEFFFGEKREFGERLEAEVDLIDPHWRTGLDRPGYALKSLQSQPFHLAHRVLQPIFEAYQVVADQLLTLTPGAKFDKVSFLDDCLGVAQSRRLRQQLEHSEAISNELFDTALQLADNRGLLSTEDDDIASRRQEFAADIAAWGRVSRRIRTMVHVALDSVDGADAPDRPDNASGGHR